MRRILHTAAAVAILVWTPAAQAEPPRIAVSAEPRTVAIGDSFELDIQVESSGIGRPDIALPPLDDFDILSKSVNTPMQFSFSFGTGSHASTTTQYRFVLVPRRTGEIRIGPVVVVQDQKRYQSQPITIQVLKAPQGARPGLGPQTPTEGTTPPAASGPESLDGARYDETLFVQTVASKTQAVVGEQVTLSLFLYSGVRLSDVNVKQEPGTDGFWAEALLASNQKIRFEDILIGDRYFQRALLRQAALFPLKPGRFTIAPAVIEALVGSGGMGLFFERQKKVVRTGVPITIEVLPLPDKDRPAGFYPGNVGAFDVQGEMSAAEADVGEPITLKILISGPGNVRSLKLDVFDRLDGFKVYEPEVTESVTSRNGQVFGQRTIRILLMPQAPGAYRIPSLSFAYFDPQAQAYQVKSTPEFEVAVRGQEAAASVQPGPAAPLPSVETPGPEAAPADSLSLRPIVSTADLRRVAGPPMHRTWWYLLLLLVPPAVLGSAWTVSRLRSRARESGAQNRWKRAAATARRRLKDAERLRQGSPEKFFGAISRALTSYLEERLSVPLGSDTTPQIRRRLVRRGYHEALADRLVHELEALDFARFASSASSAQEAESALCRASDLIRELDQTPPGPDPEEG